MNTKYLQTPTIISEIKTITIDGDENSLGSRVVSIAVEQTSNQSNGIITLDFQNFKGQNNLVLEFELFELLSAINMATLNADRSNVKP